MGSPHFRRHRIIAASSPGSGVNQYGVAGDEGMEGRFTLPTEPVGKQFRIGWRGLFHVLKKSVMSATGADKKFSADF